jgi:iron complex transport system substrate-binding protein
MMNYAGRERITPHCVIRRTGHTGICFAEEKRNSSLRPILLAAPAIPGIARQYHVTKRKLKVKRYILTILSLLFCVSFSLYANGGKDISEESAPAAESLGVNTSEAKSIVDSLGREIRLDAPVQRIAFSHVATGETLKLLDAWDLVVGRSGHLADTTMYPDLAEIPSVLASQNVYDLSYETIYELDLDLFIAVNIPVPGMDEMIDMLEPEIPVVVLNFHEAHSFRENLGKLALLLEKENEANEYLEWFDGIVDGIQQKTASIPEADRPTMFLKTGWGGVDELQTFTDAMPGMGQRTDITGCVNIAADIASTGGWVAATDPEWLTEQELDVLVIMDFIPASFGYNVDDNQTIREHRQKVMNLPVFANSSAVRNNRTFVLTTDFYSTPRFVIGYAYMARWYHPELFADSSPRELHQEYLSRFLKIDLNLDEHGVFVYPEM